MKLGKHIARFAMNYDSVHEEMKTYHETVRFSD